MRISVLLIILCCASPLFAQRYLGTAPTSSGGVLSPEQAAYDVKFYDLDIAIVPADSSISGVASVDAAVVHPLEWFVLDLDTVFDVQAVRWRAPAENSWHELPFRHTNGQIWGHFSVTRQPGERLSVKVAYRGKPRIAPHPPWVGGFTWAKTPSGMPWIATSVQTDGADLWWPCKDHPSDEPDSLSLRITVPANLVVAANGILRKVESHSSEATKTWHWFVPSPINNYGVALNIAPYQRLDTTYASTSGKIIPVSFWVLPEFVEKGKERLPQFLQHLAWYEALLGPYPFREQKYGIAQTPFYGMEHQTIIAYGANFSDEPYGYDILHHHELGHEWWGNMVTAMDWRDFWLHEGLCSYKHPLYMEHLFGREAYLKTLMQTKSKIRNRAPIAPAVSKTTREMYFLPPDYVETEGDIYNKGVWVLHTLRFIMGDTLFFKALRRMAYPAPEMEQWDSSHACRFVTTADFQSICEALYGKSLDWFFQTYVRQPDLPVLQVDQHPNELCLRWQIPAGKSFPMPVEIAVDGKTKTVEIPPEGLCLPIGSASEYSIDPNRNILMNVQQKQ